MRNRPAGESIGVVALSRTQADLVLELVNDRRSRESDVDWRFTEDLHEPFFVKNLENVQGDERDHIILCIGYGPSQPGGQPYQRFGPINSELGWRRLNVAVTRARRSMTVVHSLRPEQIVSPTSGAKWLRSFLEFVRDPEASVQRQDAVVSGREHDSDFEAAVYSALSRRGHNVQKQVGTAGFSIDLAVASEDGSRFDLGIECDGAAYHSGPAARDRDWLRQSILEGLGWCIHRVWSTDWLRNPQKEIEAIEAALNKCRSRWRNDGTFTNRLGETDLTSPSSEGSDEADNDVPLDDDSPFFDEYEVADLSGTRHGTDLGQESRSTLTNLIQGIVRTEGPIHINGLLEVLRLEYEVGQIGPRMKSHILESVRWLIKDGKLQVLPPNFLMLVGDVPRPRRPVGDFRRLIEQISKAELRAGLSLVSSIIHGAMRQELITETSRQFGYKRTDKNIQASLDEALDSLLQDGTILVDDQGLVRMAAINIENGHTKESSQEPSKAPSESFAAARSIAEEMGLKIVDKTPQGGNLWVLGGEELSQALSPLGFSFAPKGGKATDGMTAWYCPA